MVLEPLREEQYYEVDPEFVSHICLFVAAVVLGFGKIGYVTSVPCLLLFQIREPFNIMSLAKSPMGLMVGFMVIVMFIMPKLVENMGMYSTHSFVLLMFQACLCCKWGNPHF